MVTTLTSTVDGDEAPSTVDDDVALHGNLLNTPHGKLPFTATMVIEEEEKPLPSNLLLTATMVTNENAGEASKKKTKTAEVRKKKNKSG